MRVSSTRSGPIGNISDAAPVAEGSAAAPPTSLARPSDAVISLAIHNDRLR